VRPTRQIFSDPFGTADDSGGDIGPRLAPDPSTLIVGMRIWSGSKIDGIDIGYDDGAGGVTHTGRMGDQGGGSDIPPQGGRFPVDSGNPITSVNVQSGDVIDGLQFCFKDGSTSRSFGASGSYANIGYSNEMLSSIHVNGTSNFYGSIDCLVFGFQFDPDSFASTQAVQQLYPPTSSS
jgi:hypothetical protein